MDLQQLYLLTQRYRLQLQGVTAAGDDRLLTVGGLSGPLAGASGGGLPTVPPAVGVNGVKKEGHPPPPQSAVDECSPFGLFGAMLAAGGGGGVAGAGANALLAHCLERFYADSLIAATSARCPPTQPSQLALQLPPPQVPVPHHPVSLPGAMPMLLPALAAAAAEPNANQALELMQYLGALCNGYSAQTHDRQVEAAKLQEMAHELLDGSAGHSSPLNLSLNPSSSTPSTTAGSGSGSAPSGPEKLGPCPGHLAAARSDRSRELYISPKKEAASPSHSAAATPASASASASPHKIAHSTHSIVHYSGYRLCVCLRVFDVNIHLPR